MSKMAAKSMQQMQAEIDSLTAELALLREAIELLPQGLSAFDAQNRLVLANAEYRRIWRLPADVVRRGSTFAEILAVTPGQETEASQRQPKPTPGTSGTRRREWLLDDGSRIEVLVSRRADGSCVALHRDVTEQRRFEDRINFLARHDPLTGLPNRGVLRDELDRRLTAEAPTTPFALLCIDLDRFKPVNDQLGHAAGDDLLEQVGRRLRGCVREFDLVARMGGDEFAIILDTLGSADDAVQLADRIVRILSEPFTIREQSVAVGASIGLAFAPQHGSDTMTLMQNADLALYRAKQAGRGRACCFSPDGAASNA